MFGSAPQADLVEGWIARALEVAPPDSAARAKALIARCYSDYDKSAELAGEASGIAERLGDPVIRSYGYDVLGLTAFVTGDYQEAAEWAGRRLSLVDEIQDPDHQQDIYETAFAPAVACGQFDEARGYAASQEEITRRLSPHHRVHGVSSAIGKRRASCSNGWRTPWWRTSRRRACCTSVPCWSARLLAPTSVTMRRQAASSRKPRPIA
jgi:hypothetical protein